MLENNATDLMDAGKGFSHFLNCTAQLRVNNVIILLFNRFALKANKENSLELGSKIITR